MGYYQIYILVFAPAFLEYSYYSGIFWGTTILITFRHYYIDYFGVLPLTQYFTADHIDFLFELCKFLCYFILFACIYTMILAQKKPGPCPKIINETTRLFSGLADLDYKPGYDNHVYFQYLSNNKNDISLLGAYHPEEIYSKYIVRVSGKGFTVVDHPSEVYGLPDTHECIDGNLPLRLVLDIDARQKPDPINPELPSLDGNKISREDLLSRILIACANILCSDLKHFLPLNAFTLASSSNANKCS